jgi:hypothetical protein
MDTKDTTRIAKIAEDMGYGVVKLEGEHIMTRAMAKKSISLNPETLKPLKFKALKGLQNAMVDEILRETPYYGYPGELLTSAKMADKFRKYDPALKVIFKDSPKKLEAMHTVRKAIKALEYKTGEKMGMGKTNLATNVVTRVALISGHSMAAATDISRHVMNNLKGISKEKVHGYINRGILDPETAYEFVNAIKRGGSAKRIGHYITQSLVRLGLVRPKDVKKEDRIKPWTFTLPDRKTRKSYFPMTGKN